jgi:hypothetical protein
MLQRIRLSVHSAFEFCNLCGVYMIVLILILLERLFLFFGLFINLIYPILA